MRKLYEIFKVLKVQKRIVSAETICGNTVYLTLCSTNEMYQYLHSRVRPRFFDQVGHETMYASSGNKHFFTKSCHRQTYQNYEQSRQKLGTILENKVS